jgi:hypothetical protein
MRLFGKALGGGRRSAVRTQAPLLAVLSTVADDHRAAIVDVSELGARLCAPYLPSEGENLIFTADHVQAFGHVIWSRRNECGIAFESMITSGDVERLRRAADLPTIAA